MLNFNNQLHDLARKNNRLKSKLRHARLKNNTFKLNHSFIKDKSLIRTGFNRKVSIGKVIGNSEFKDLESVNDYTLSNEGPVWIYTTVIDGEKISLISSDYERLCKKIKERQLPF